MKKFLLGLLVVLVLTGCQQPTFDNYSVPEVELEQETLEQEETAQTEKTLEQEETAQTEEILEEEIKEPEIDYSDRTIPGVEDDSDYEIEYITELLTSNYEIQKKFDQYISFGESAGFTKEDDKGVITHRNPGGGLTNEFFKMVELENEYKDAYWRWRNDHRNEDKLLNANKLLFELCNRARYMFYEISDARENSCNRVYEKLLF